jgi:hypothetical protein
MPPAKTHPPRSVRRRPGKSAALAPGRQPGNARPVPVPRPAHPRAPAITIDAILADLAAKQVRLSELLDAADPSDLKNLARLFSIHSQNASRLGRLMRDQRALSGKAADGIAGAIAQALDELSNELGQPL